MNNKTIASVQEAIKLLNLSPNEADLVRATVASAYVQGKLEGIRESREILFGKGGSHEK